MLERAFQLLNNFLGNQHPEHERRARCPDVQELPVKRPFPFRRYFYTIPSTSQFLLTGLKQPIVSRIPHDRDEL